MVGSSWNYYLIISTFWHSHPHLIPSVCVCRILYKVQSVTLKIWLQKTLTSIFHGLSLALLLAHSDEVSCSVVEYSMGRPNVTKNQETPLSNRWRTEMCLPACEEQARELGSRSSCLRMREVLANQRLHVASWQIQKYRSHLHHLKMPDSQKPR